MDRRELLDKTARSEEERLLLSRVWDKREQCRLRSIPTATAFLSPQEQAAATRLLNALGDREGYALWGGYEGAERRRLLFLPDWMAEPDDSAVAALRAVCRSGASLTHRDFLGSLMALGLTREKIGDILVESGGCQVLVDPLSLDFLTQSWDSAGRERLTVTPLPLEELTVPQAVPGDLSGVVDRGYLQQGLPAMTRREQRVQIAQRAAREDERARRGAVRAPRAADHLPGVVDGRGIGLGQPRQLAEIQRTTPSFYAEAEKLRNQPG